LRVAIFTGSSLGPGAHVEAATTFAVELVGAGTSIVYGGGRVGLMGVVADAAMSAGGEVIGVIPGFLVDREVAHQGLSRLEVVATMHERKARMAELADVFVALPGGVGTLSWLRPVISTLPTWLPWAVWAAPGTCSNSWLVTSARPPQGVERASLPFGGPECYNCHARSRAVTRAGRRDTHAGA
jgi:hypothetical protein